MPLAEGRLGQASSSHRQNQYQHRGQRGQHELQVLQQGLKHPPIGNSVVFMLLVPFDNVFQTLVVLFRAPDVPPIHASKFPREEPMDRFTDRQALSLLLGKKGMPSSASLRQLRGMGAQRFPPNIHIRQAGGAREIDRENRTRRKRQQVEGRRKK